jgi:hypothetical protein
MCRVTDYEALKKFEKRPKNTPNFFSEKKLKKMAFLGL